LEIVELVNTMMMIKILIVEDQIITAMDMRMKLEDAGYEVTDIISFGEDVLQSVKANEPNLVLLDIGLAGKMNGIEDTICGFYEKLENSV
jgi:CheY-like chemotaxis protein